MAGDLLERVRAEIDARRKELRPHLAEYERLLSAAEALGIGIGEAGVSLPRAAARRAARPAAVARKPAAGRSSRGAAPKAPKRKAATPKAATPKAAPARRPPTARSGKTRSPALRGAAQHAIAAALEHGSHTVGELAVVTAMSAPSVRESLRRMLSAGTVERARREGKAAYALAAAAVAGR
jgi:DNA-binding transcriptional ArsR family regulator